MRVATFWYTDSAPSTFHLLIHLTHAMMSTSRMRVVARVASSVDTMTTGHRRVAIPAASAAEMSMTGMMVSLMSFFWL